MEGKIRLGAIIITLAILIILLGSSYSLYLNNPTQTHESFKVKHLHLLGDTVPVASNSNSNSNSELESESKTKNNIKNEPLPSDYEKKLRVFDSKQNEKLLPNNGKECEDFVGYSNLAQYASVPPVSPCRNLEADVSKNLQCYRPSSDGDLAFCEQKALTKWENLKLTATCDVDLHYPKLKSNWYNTGLKTVFQYSMRSLQESPSGFNPTTNPSSSCKQMDHRPVFFMLAESRLSQGNVGHEFAGLYSMFLTRRALNISDTDKNVLIVHMDTPSFTDKWQIYSMFSNEPIKVASDLTDGTCYTHTIFPMPWSMSPYWKIHWDALNGCHDHPMFSSFLSQILDHYDALSIPAPSKPRILWVSREDAGTRVIPHLSAIQAWLRPQIDAGLLEFEVVRLADLPFREQVRAARRANILVASNGSGMMLGQFLAHEAVVLEVLWTGGAPPQFRNVLKLAGKVHVGVVARWPVLDYDRGRNVKVINVTMEQLQKGIRAAVGIASGFGKSMYLVDVKK
jgi:hypothetical protein